ncbi:MAG: DegT/DnrJ/EryC1/StrS family aminotransferase [Bacteroidales bacterium]
MAKLLKPYSFCYVSNSLSKGDMLKSCLDILFFQKNKRMRQFKQLISDYFSVHPNKVFLFGAGRMGVYSLLKSMNLNQNDEVIVAGYTCVVLTNVVKFADCKIKYVDISAETLNIDTRLLLNSISENTKALILPHNFGILYTDIPLIKEKFPNIIIIEDAAHSLGSTTPNDAILCGLAGDASFFSLEFSKPISTGLGGILIVNNELLLEKMQADFANISYFSFYKVLKIFITFLVLNLSMWKKSNFFLIISAIFLRRTKLLYATSKEEIYGQKPMDYPVKLSPSLSVFGYYQMAKIEAINKQKKEIALQYFNFFKQFSSIQQFYHPSYVFVRYPIVFADSIKNDVIQKIKSDAENEGLILGDWFNDVVHPDGVFRYGYSLHDCKVGENVSVKIINLPVNINMKPSNDMLESLKKIFINNGIQ